MKFLEKISCLLSNRIRLISALAGFVTGFYLFFDSPTLLGLLAVSLIFSLGFLFVFGMLGGFVYTQFQGLPIDQSTLKYNPITRDCEEVQVGGGDKPAWYHSECDEEKLREYCERQVNKGVEANVSICLKHLGGLGS